MRHRNTKNKVSIFKKISRYLGNKRIFVSLAIILSAIAAVINMLPFYYIWNISNEIFANGSAISTEKIIQYAWLVFLFAVLGIFIYFAALLLLQPGPSAMCTSTPSLLTTAQYFLFRRLCMPSSRACSRTLRTTWRAGRRSSW